MNSDANRKRIQDIEQCFGNSGQPLVLPGRVLVGEGVLTKLCRKKPKPRQFFLLNDMLVYGNIVINKTKYNKQKLLPLENVRIQSHPDVGDLKNGWQIISPSKSFVVFAATSTEKTEWMAHINKCVQDLLNASGKTPSLETSPVWIPDSQARGCMLCSTPFTMLNRRHHCRKCGKLVCDDCSKHRWNFPQQSSKPQRVCNTCYKDLNSTSNLNMPSEPPMSDSDSEDSDDEDETENGDRKDEAQFYGGQN
ncbi:pleckstrin homology domain-containing family F member 2-like isoform X2 [Watersipora subatra]|uniref:pleckstrin homology domain-containing family F member 2-like isoform X2 n=1 Tax=Watersipora subatra TaxID=2589382 RepID=UPI00355C38A1